MYKELLEKGFKPVYYTNADWFESRSCKSRLFYRYVVESKEIFNAILNVLGIFDEYFSMLEVFDDIVVQIEANEKADEFWVYFINTEADGYQIPENKLDGLWIVLPNDFTFECADD